MTFGIAEELSSDGGPEFKAGSTKTFLKNWGIRHRISSVANPHSNCRAEVGVKTVKRMLVGSTGHVSLQKHARSDVEGQSCRNHLWTPHPGLHPSAAWTVPTPLDMARDNASKRGRTTYPTHEGTWATVGAHTGPTSTHYRQLRKATELGWPASNQVGPHRNRG